MHSGSRWYGEDNSLANVDKDEITKEFDHKMWVCIFLHCFPYDVNVKQYWGVILCLN
ncbi:hypothetical protein KFK09_010180 [Dendrobium nobile]|uniref:Uncharacterized protein n=1 Tax=Dendrobium nobile TaxID=94219 RepID=A0A8T3BPL0_DENNO|nr:hypothetical protein KFK09_010180 [Dendrobium nobile]